MSNSRIQLNYTILLGAVFCLLYLAFLGVRPLFIPDEVRYGEIAREMIETGNWIVPRLNGLLYFEKPPFGHWLNAISLVLFGENPFAVRFASALTTGVSTAAVVWLGKHLFTSRSVPYFAAFIFLTCFEVWGAGTYAVLDSTFATLLNIGIAVFAIGVARNGRARYYWLAAAGFFFGCAFLAKGFLAFVLPVIVLGPWLVIIRRYDVLFRYAWLTVAVALVVVAPWAIAIHLQQADFWHYFFWIEHVQRFAAENAQHKEPVYYFLMLLPVAGLPWIFLLPSAARGLRSRPRDDDTEGATALLVLWALMPLLFFSAASGKLLTYILPCFLPFALLMASGLRSSIDNARSQRISIVATAVLLAIAAIALAYVYVRPPAEAVFLDTEFPKFAALLAVLVFAVVTLGYGVATSQASRRILCSGIAVMPLFAILPLCVPQLAFQSKAPVAFLEQVSARHADDTIVVADGSFARAVSWTLKRKDIYVVDNGGETSYGLEAPDGRGRYLSPDMFFDLVRSGEDVLLFCKKGCKQDTLDQLPPNTVSSEFGNFTAYFIDGSTAG